MREYMKSFRQQLKANREQINQISNILLADSTDYTKNSYLKMLAVILQQANEIPEEQLSMYRRVVLGANAEYSVEDFLRMALEIDIETYNNFLMDMKKTPLGYRFLLDGLVIIMSAQDQEEQMQFIAELFQDLEVAKKEIEVLINIAQGIIKSDEELFWYVSELNLEHITNQVYSEYVDVIPRSTHYINDKMIVISSTSKTAMEIKELEELIKHPVPVVKIIGLHINLLGRELWFKEKKEVVFESCTFVGGGSSSLHLEGCENIIIKDTTFKSFSNRVLQLEEISGAVDIRNCAFLDCKLVAVRERFKECIAGVIFSNHPECIQAVNIIDSTFTNCGILCQGIEIGGTMGRDRRKPEGAETMDLETGNHPWEEDDIILSQWEMTIGILGNIVCSVINCKFNDCTVSNGRNIADTLGTGCGYRIHYKGIGSPTYMDLELFNKGSKLTNCTLDKQTKFYVNNR